jgi:glycosyltransferase involved in cell wall biosynthesis
MQKSKMKIGIVLPSVPAYSETFFANKIKGLEANGYEVILFVNHSHNKVNSNYTCRFSPNLNGTFIKVSVVSLVILCKIFVFNYKFTSTLFRLNKKDGMPLVKNLKNCLINSHLLYDKLDWLHFGFGTMAIERENVAQAIGAKMAVSFRGFDHYVYPVKNKNCYSTLYSKKVKYHVLSEGMKRSLISFGVNEENILKITPAININLFENHNEKTTNTILQIKTIARLHWIKGLEYTLEALSLLKQKGINFHYTIIGSGPEKERLQFGVHQLGLIQNVTFTGKLKPEEVKDELEKTDVYIQYSIQEGFCNAVLEAQAMGAICIVSDAEGLSENVIDGLTGFVVPKRNPILLCNKIIQVVGYTSKEKNLIVKESISRIKSLFSLNAQNQNFINFYEENKML